MSRYTRGWVFQSFMSALGLGQKMPPLALRSLATSSTTVSFFAVMLISDFGEPVGVFRIAAIDDVVERVLQLLGDRAAPADADLHAIEFADGRHFGGGAGEEALVGDVDLVARDALLHDLDAQVLGDVEHRVPRDSVQGARGQVRRVDHAVLDHEHVLAGAFGHEARAVEQQRLVVAVVQRFHVGEDGVAVVAHRLGLRHRDVDVVARVAGGLHADAALHAFLAQVGAPGPGRDHQVDLVAFGAHAQFLRADPRQRADVAAFQLVGAHDLLLRLVHLLLGEGHLHAQDLGAVEQAIGVFLQAEDGRAVDRVVGTYALEDAAAVMQRVGEHVDLGVAPFDQLAVHPDLAVTVGHRGYYRAHGVSLFR